MGGGHDSYRPSGHHYFKGERGGGAQGGGSAARRCARALRAAAPRG
jgi:hypothetical protein